jgi:hypothetical protein
MMGREEKEGFIASLEDECATDAFSQVFGLTCYESVPRRRVRETLFH